MNHGTSLLQCVLFSGDTHENTPFGDWKGDYVLAKFCIATFLQTHVTSTFNVQIAWDNVLSYKRQEDGKVVCTVQRSQLT
jgi:hypothetical protein